MVRDYERSEARQEQIIDAARSLLVTFGSDYLTVKRIAHEVGITETAVYRHFKSKKDILSSLADCIEENLVGDITKATQNGRSPLGSLEAVLTNHISAIERRKGVSFQVIAEIISFGDGELSAKVRRSIERYTDCLKNLLELAVKSGEIKSEINLDAAALALFGMIQGLVNIWALYDYSFDPHEKFNALWKLFRKAILS